MTRRGRHARPNRWHRRWAGLWVSDEGRVSAFVMVLTTGILTLAGLTLDGGLALAAKIKANGQAEAAARAAAQAIDLNAYRSTGQLHLLPAQAVAQGQRYLAGVGARGTVTITGDTVTVTITTSQRTQLLGLVGISTLSVHGHGSAHPQPGLARTRP